ncbi:MAG: carboxypeptidase regulatory-like domain-containing protein [Planctomycetes bacterium]|nr:carboxypeptidase regulatory-like domain-containing protein [Planctomycetota bacterium]
MNRRSLLLLIAFLGLACGALFLLLDPGREPAAVEAGVNLGSPAAEAQTQPEALTLTSEARRSERGGPRLGTPRIPARPAPAPATCRVAGWLRPQEDKPWSDASVALVRGLESGVPQLLAQARCESDGGFVIDCASEGHATLLALARGYLPRTQDLELSFGQTQTLADLDLDPGVAIAGTLRANTSPLARFEVVAIDERDLPLLQLEAGALLWNGAGFDWRFTTAESGPDGHYSIGGLHPGEYSVRVSTCRGPFASLCSGDRSPRSVRAPSAEADFGFESSALALRFQSAGQPLAGVRVELTNGRWTSGRNSDARGVVSFELVPRLDCTLVASKQGYEDLRVPVCAPASGASATEEFELRPKAPAPSVRFLLSSRHGAPPDELRVRLFERGANEDTQPLRDVELHPTRESCASPVKEFVLEDLRPGSYRALLFAGTALNNDFDPANYIGTHCPVELLFALPSQGELRQSVSADRRPALRLSFQDERGAQIPATCTLRDENGEELRSVLVDPAQGVPLSGHALSKFGPTLVYSSVCSGKVLVSVEDGDKQLYSGTQTLLPGAVSAITQPR